MIAPPPHEDLFTIEDGEYIISEQATEQQRKEILEWAEEFDLDDRAFEIE